MESKSPKTEVPEKTHPVFDELSVVKGRVGNIKVGDRVPFHKQYLSKFKKIEVDALFYGFDGGGSAFEYYDGKELVFALIPAYETDSIIAIAVCSDNYSFAGGYKVGMSAGELKNHLPDYKVELSLMDFKEYVYDEKNGAAIVFATKEKNEVGKYKYEVMDEESEPLNLKPLISYILI